VNKENFRIEIKSRIAGLECEYINESNRGIFRNIESLPEFISASRVFIYCSIGREVDTISIINHCFETGKQVALPTDYTDGKMNFARLDCPIAELPRGKFDIPVPGESAERLKPAPDDIIIVPALAFDESLYRIGRGGGYYDRYLSECPAFSVGLCREKLVVPCVPRDIHDISVSLLVTEQRIARPKSAPQK
jgi:5-formyltetrahydrofolate cyclo-ligase